jgi:hypothetical protein
MGEATLKLTMLSIMIPNLMMPSIIGLIGMLSIKTTLHKLYSALCVLSVVFFIVTLSAVMLSVIELRVMYEKCCYVES